MKGENRVSEPYIIFNGTDSRELGVVMEKLPDFHRAMRNVELIAVPGRDGRLEQDERTHDVYTTDMKVNCFGVPLSSVYAWLSGAGWMISSDEPDRAVWVSIHMPIKPTRFRVNGACYDSLICTVYCQPYRYFHPEAEDAVITASPGEIENPGTWQAQPIIAIVGNGDFSIMLGQYQMDFEGIEGGIIVDCENEECMSLDGAELLNDRVNMDEYPRLAPGANYIQWDGTGRIESITVRRRCRDV